MSKLLEIKGLEANIGDKAILKGVDLNINEGEVHVIMGPNGSGKSTLANVIMGHPKFEVEKGSITMKKEDVLDMEPEERAKHGIFMAFQYPKEIAGVAMDRFLYTAYKNIFKARHPEERALTVFQFKKKLKAEVEKLKMKSELSTRSLNEGFSGGEKKKAEMLQLSLLQPDLAILDETDSGLDVDALKIVGEAVNAYKKENKKRSVLIVTHYQRILDYVKPDFVHVMVDGRIVTSGDASLVEELEKEGYEKYL